MNERVIRRVHEVLGSGLELLERLERGESPRLEVEHSKLLNLLLAGGELDYDPIYNGELATAAGRATLTQGVADRFFGVRYALACWLDEVMLRDSPDWWQRRWEADTMEVRLYVGSNLRGVRFWEQARKAEGPRGSPEALEAYLWWVMLGIRGEPAVVGPPIDPAKSVENVRRRVVAAHGADFPVPQQRDAPTYAPALRGPDRLVGML